MDSYRKIARNILREIRLETLGKPRSIAEDVTEVVQVIEDVAVANSAQHGFLKQEGNHSRKLQILLPPLSLQLLNKNNK